MTDAIDLFGGAGGAAMGMHLLGLTEHGIEWGEQECATREAAGFAVTRGDVSALDPNEWTGVEGMWASPPCPDWSVAGKGKGRDGKTGWLVDEPIRWARALRPRWIAMENVPPVEAVFREQALELQAMGYWTWVGVLSAEEYGVPQTRRRAHLMASLDHPVGPPAPTHQSYVPGVPAQEVHTWTGTLRPWVSMAEALGWGCTERPFTTLPTAGGSRGGMGDGAGGSGGRATIERERERGAWMVNTGRDWKVGGTRQDAQTIPFTAPAPALTAIAGSQWLLQPGKYVTDKVENRRLYEPDEPAPTIAFGHDASSWCWVRPSTTIAGDPRVWPPGHKVNSGDRERLGAEEADEKYGDRAGRESIKLTVYEALALQAMPTNYPLVGSRTAALRQVGNLVTPFTAASLVGELLGLDWRAAIDAVTNGR